MKRVIRCTKFHFSRINHLNVEFLNWWWRYRVGSRDPKVGQITSNDHHYKCAKFHNFPMFPS